MSVVCLSSELFFLLAIVPAHRLAQQFGGSGKDIHEIVLGFIRIPRRRLILPGDDSF
jgi:hypothetical protein